MTSFVEFKTCSCHFSIDTLTCGKCGGLLPPLGILSKIKEHTTIIASWLQQNNRRIAERLSTGSALEGGSV